MKIDRYFALFYFRRTKLFFKENANSFLPRWIAKREDFRRNRFEKLRKRATDPQVNPPDPRM